MFSRAIKISLLAFRRIYILRFLFLPRKFCDLTRKPRHTFDREHNNEMFSYAVRHVRTEPARIIEGTYFRSHTIKGKTAYVRQSRTVYTGL